MPNPAKTEPARFTPTLRLVLPAATLLLALGAGTALAQNPAPAPPPRPTCNTVEHRAFDFWVGSWDVTVGGNQAGTNLITREQDGCILHEHWVGSRGGTGQSFNFYDRASGEWNQIWVDNSGGVLRFTGTFVNGALHYKSIMPQLNGSTAEHRLTFTPDPDGSVRQLWQTTTDGGATWVTAFDGRYRKKGS